MIADKMKNMVANSSAIRAMFEEGTRLAGIYGRENVFDFSLGNPNVPAPQIVKDAIVELVNDTDPVVLHGYTNSNSGYPEVREAIAKSLNERFDTKFSGKNIVMTVGAAGGLNVILKSLINPGDEVIAFAPYFGEYRSYTNNYDGVLVEISPNTVDFQPKLDEFEQKITPKTKAMIINYPSNPTGGVMTKEDYAKIIDIIKESGIYVISDEIYAELSFDQPFASLAQFDEIKSQIIVVNGFSKAYAMTGWRLGYCMANKELSSVMNKIHQYVIMSAPVMSQYAGIEAIKNGYNDVLMMKDDYLKRRNFLVNRLNRMGLKTNMPHGTFYVFCNIQSTGLDSETFCERLLQEQKVACVPGNAFGNSGEGYVRISYAYSIDHIKEAVVRLEQFLKDLDN